jgi:hypothetical protein
MEGMQLGSSALLFSQAKASCALSTSTHYIECTASQGEDERFVSIARWLACNKLDDTYAFCSLAIDRAMNRQCNPIGSTYRTETRPCI